MNKDKKNKKKKGLRYAFRIPSAEAERSERPPLNWTSDKSFAVAKSTSEQFNEAQRKKAEEKNNS